MPSQYIQAYKRRSDIRSIEFSFSEKLLPGETLVSADVNLTVFSGADNNVAEMIYGGVSIIGATVSQRIGKGKPGVVYQLAYLATTSFGNRHEQLCKLAILPDAFPVKPIFTTYYFTTTIYPINSIEGVGAVGDLGGRNFMWEVPVDGVEVISAALNGTLRDIVQTYATLPEGVEVFSDALDGDMRDIVITYEMKPEGVDVVSTALNGTMKNVLIIYSNYPPEGVAVQSIALPGTLI